MDNDTSPDRVTAVLVEMAPVRVVLPPTWDRVPDLGQLFTVVGRMMGGALLGRPPSVLQSSDVCLQRPHLAGVSAY